jgi:hypothetical protein
MLLDKLASDQFRIHLEMDQLAETLRGVQRAADRLSLGVVAGAALIAGSTWLRTRR